MCFGAAQVKEAVEAQLTELGCSSKMTTDEIKEAAKRTIKLKRSHREDSDQAQSWLKHEEKRQVTLQAELNWCKQRSQQIREEWTSRF